MRDIIIENIKESTVPKLATINFAGEFSKLTYLKEHGIVLNPLMA